MGDDLLNHKHRRLYTCQKLAGRLSVPRCERRLSHEFKITPEMIEAGAEELRRHVSVDRPPILPWEEVVELLLRAMSPNLRLPQART
jgi:hypothetical protein